MPRSTSTLSRSPESGTSDRDSSVTLTELIWVLLEQKGRCQESSPGGWAVPACSHSGQTPKVRGTCTDKSVPQGGTGAAALRAQWRSQELISKPLWQRAEWVSRRIFALPGKIPLGLYLAKHQHEPGLWQQRQSHGLTCWALWSRQAGRELWEPLGPA